MRGRGRYTSAPRGIWGRREFVRIGSIGLLGLNLWDYFKLPAAEPAKSRHDRGCILIWLMGGPPQQDMWDMKPEAPTEYRGTFKPIPTNVPGIQICEHMPRCAKIADKYAIIRSMTGKTAQHEPAQDYVLSGYTPLASLAHPSVGSVVAKEKGGRDGLPPYVAVPGTAYAFGPGFLGAGYAPFDAGDPSLSSYKVRDLNLPTDVNWDDVSDRRRLLSRMDQLFLEDPLVRGADTRGELRSVDNAHERALSLMMSEKARNAFDVADEPEQIRDLYGRTPVGQGCLLARRLIEAGTRFVTVTSPFNVWDTHVKNFEMLEHDLLPPLDMALAGLLTDLEQRGMLESTLVVVNGEFGRTPKVNSNAGRDHWPNVWSCLMAGAGIRGGQLYGSSDANAAEVRDNPVSVEDYTATIYQRLGIDFSKEYQTPIGRPIYLSTGKPINLS